MINTSILSTAIKAGIAANTRGPELPEVVIDARHFTVNPFGISTNANLADFPTVLDRNTWIIDIGPGYQKLLPN